MKFIILFLLVLGSIGADEQLQGSSYLQRDAYLKPEDYVFDYSPTATSSGVRVTQKYGSATFMQIPQNPSLIGTTLGGSRFDMKPCTILQPYTHRVDGQIYVLEGQLRAGFVIQSFGKLIENKLEAGKGMVFPRGSLMYLQNLTPRRNASFIVSYGSNDFDVDLMVSLLFHSLPSDITRYAMDGLTQSEYEKIKNSISDNEIYSIK